VQLGMVGLGRMGAGMVRRLMDDGHDCVVHDLDPNAIQALVRRGAEGADSIDAFVEALEPPRTVWMMVPAQAVDETIDRLVPWLEEGDAVVDGGNSHYVDDLRRGPELAARGIDFLDVGVSGGVWGLERGYCLMIGGQPRAAARLDPVFRSLAPGRGSLSRTHGRSGDLEPAEMGYLHCGPTGAGHFVKMVHNGIEYGLMAAYAEGFNILHRANRGAAIEDVDAEHTPLRHPEHYRYDFDVAEIAEVWRRGSVVASWLLDLLSSALTREPALDGFEGRVADSGEGRWTVLAAVEEGAPAPVISAALFSRFSSRGQARFADRVVSAMRHAFGGHLEQTPEV
jgi:6-phosphogluconate dehydrogenase